MKEEKPGKIEKVLQELGKSIDELVVKARNSKGPVKKEMDNRIEELKRNKKTLEKEFEKFKKDHSGDIDKFEKSVKKTAGEVKKSVGDIFSKLKKK
jgi:vacuolar-type H+-ATPase subunit I/STV1